ncbi:MAG TPA: hypothetical protein VLD66_06375 [Methyloceanibacter sp.]|nr:hypothetical protein [Methyloceanibacter sp.]
MSDKILESVIERKACDYYVRHGALTRKLNGMGNRSWPDRLVVGFGFSFMIEFKRPGFKLTPLQASLHGKLKKRKYRNLYVTDNLAEAIAIFDRLAASAAAPRVPAQRRQVHGVARRGRAAVGSRFGKDHGNALRLPRAEGKKSR